MRELITILGPGAAVMHLAWLASYWVNRGITLPTLMSGVVDVCLIYLTGQAAISIIRRRLSESTEQVH